MKKFVSVLLSVLLLFCAAIPAFAEEAPAEPFDSFGAYEHVFIIGVDGGGAAFSLVNTPNFDRIFADNACRYNAKTETVTVSAQNWGSILCGVPYDVHGFDNGSIEANERSSGSPNPSIFYYARQKYPDAVLASFCNWDPINHGIIENDLNVHKVHRGTDPLVTDAIVEYISKGNAPKLMFVQLDSVDHAAHTYGGFSHQYYSAVAKMDTMLGDIYDAIDAQGLMANSLFIVVADHGENNGGHGGTSVEESSVMLAVAGHSVNVSHLEDGYTQTVRNRDVAAIALYALGIEQPEHFECSVPQGLFGESRDKLTGSNPMGAVARFFRRFAYLFVRMINKLVGLFGG